MKQYYITQHDIPQDSNDDCYLAPEDPIHELKIGAMLGGLGAEQRIAEYRASQKVINTNSGIDRNEIMKSNNIKPGSAEYIKLWFAKPNLTGEKPI